MAEETLPWQTQKKARRSHRRTQPSNGFTGQTLVLAPAEQAAYKTHVDAYIYHHAPYNHQIEQLVRQLAYLDWSLHQISVQQINVIGLMNAVQAAGTEDPAATAHSVAGLSFDPQEFGFVCSNDDIDGYLRCAAAVKLAKTPGKNR
jgi:hypothetical protein